MGDSYARFKNLSFDRFRQLALDDSMSRYEKIGFPNSYRQGKEEHIFKDITGKLRNLEQRNKVVLDIGPGCSGLAFLLIELCRRNEHTLLLVDSEEMLSHLPDESFVRKIPSYYPKGCGWLFETYANRVDVILTYSVIHYVFTESNVFDFVDRSIGLLAANGEMLIGDIPNLSKRRRFFSSPAGVRYHQEFTGTSEVPKVEFNTLETGDIDDAVILSLLMRCRNSGVEAYLLPQSDELPMANRREDILIRKS